MVDRMLKSNLNCVCLSACPWTYNNIPDVLFVYNYRAHCSVSLTYSQSRRRLNCAGGLTQQLSTGETVKHFVISVSVLLHCGGAVVVADMCIAITDTV